MPNLILNGRTVECELVLFDFDGTLVEDNFRNSALGEARFEEIIRLAGTVTALKWSELSGYDPKNGEC